MCDDPTQSRSRLCFVDVGVVTGQGESEQAEVLGELQVVERFPAEKSGMASRTSLTQLATAAGGCVFNPTWTHARVKYFNMIRGCMMGLNCILTQFLAIETCGFSQRMACTVVSYDNCDIICSSGNFP